MLGGVGLDHEAAKVLGGLTRHKDREHGTFRTNGAGGFDHFFLRTGPTVTHPNRNTRTVAGRNCGVSADDETAGLLAQPLGFLDRADDLFRFGVEQFIAPKLNGGVVVVELRLAVAELAVPLAALAGLQAIFVADRHQHALVGEVLQCGLDLGAQLAVVGGQVIHEQVGNVVLVGADAGV